MYQPSPSQSTAPQAGRIARFYGVRAGLLLGIAQSVLIIYLNHGSYSPYNALWTPMSLLLWVGAFLFAGILTSRRTRKTSTGTLAGLWAGLFGGVITAATMLFELVSSLGYGYGFDEVGIIVVIIAGSLTGLILLVLFTMGVGTGLGALGGLIGQSLPTPTNPAQAFRQQEPSQQQTDEI